MFPKFIQDSILASEGGYVNDAADPGGETKYGISKRAYPDVDIKALTRDAALALYERDYWNKMKLDLLPVPLALLVFDFGVNAGRKKAIKTLQTVLGIAADGALGPVTARSAAQAPDVLRKYTDARIAYYKALQKPRFEKGWINRAERVYTEAVSAALGTKS